MEYKYPPLPVRNEVVDGLWEEVRGPYDEDQMRQYAEQAVAPLLAEIERLEKFAEEKYSQGKEEGYQDGYETCYKHLRG